MGHKGMCRILCPDVKSCDSYQPYVSVQSWAVWHGNTS